MGSSKSSLIGPYAKIQVPVIKEKEVKTYASCSNPSCPEHKVRSEKNFCDNCGSLVTLSEKTLYNERKLNFYDFMYDLGVKKVKDGLGEEMDDDSFRGFDESYFLEGVGENEMVVFHDGSSIDIDEAGIFELEAYNSVKVLEDFRKRIKPLIEELVKVGMTDNVTYHFGGVTYWS